MSAPTAASLHIAYADPPYPGQAHRYRNHRDYAGEVDHAKLIKRLCDEWPDGWALSTSSPTLAQVLALCPSDVRIAAWVKPFAIFKPNVGVAYAWEPVIFRGGRRRTRTQPTVRDWCAVNITLRRGLCGVKPEAFCFWLFDVLNLQPGDVLDDLFPGSGAVSTAWNHYQHQLWNTG